MYFFDYTLQLLQILSGPLLWLSIGFGAPANSGHTPPLEYRRGPTGGNRLALTFDIDEGGTEFLSLLRELRMAKVHSTFFVTGKWAQENPALVRQLAADGHEIGNGTWNHLDLTRLSNREIIFEIQHTYAVLGEILGQAPPKLFRAPFGIRNDRVLTTAQSLGFVSVHWTIDSHDTLVPKKTPQYLFDRIGLMPLENIDGATVLMHADQPATVTALPYIVSELQARGFHCVTISELFQPPAKRPSR